MPESKHARRALHLCAHCTILKFLAWMIAWQRIQAHLSASEIQRDQEFAQHIRADQPILDPDETLIRYADQRVTILHVSNSKPLGDRSIPARQLRVIADSAHRRIRNSRQADPLRRWMREYNARRACVQHQPHWRTIHRYFQTESA